jgi:hypothetical protein
MDEKPWLAQHFEEPRPPLAAVVYRIPGSHTEVDDSHTDT